ncbi:hypothetical protein [Inediibacterium massiliense]|uniref:hypothetical protein n=1 Tax=Inediibacterium massiliense TaxID=1658111 RepID=UPI002E8E1679|nr:hypothetical protein [Inediibacterium massiliense]
MDFGNINQYIRSIELQRDKISNFNKYPFCLRAICNLSTLQFHPKVTFIVGGEWNWKINDLRSNSDSIWF